MLNFYIYIFIACKIIIWKKKIFLIRFFKNNFVFKRKLFTFASKSILDNNET